MKKIFLITLLTLCSACGIPAWAEDNTIDKDDLQILFQDADIIKNQSLDKGEFDIFHFQSFKRLDADNDGILLNEECIEDCFDWRMWYGTNFEKESEITDIIRQSEFIFTPYRFDAIDANSNGQLSIEEYVEFGRGRFQYFDENNDSIINISEFCAGYNSSMPCDFSDSSGIEIYEGFH